MTEADATIFPFLSQLSKVEPRFIDASVLHIQHLSGGAINRNDRLQLNLNDGSLCDLVMRRGRGAPVPGTLNREEEFQLVEIMFKAGVPVPQPVATLEVNQTQASFFGWCEGVTDPRLIVRSFESLPEQQLESLSNELGKILGRIHSEDVALTLSKGHALPHGARPADGLSASIDMLKKAFAQVQSPPSYLKFALDCVCDEASRFPDRRPAVLCHNDFRLGNLMLSRPSGSIDIDTAPISNPRSSSSRSVVKAVLDWEFAAWGDPMSDLGWLTASCWRFGGPRPVAGFLPLEPFLTGYRASMFSFDEAWIAELSFWQRFAHVRWAIIASQQGERALSTDEESLELMITGLMTASIVQPVVEHYLKHAVGPYVTPSSRHPTELRGKSAEGAGHLPEFHTLLREAWRLLRHEVASSDEVKGKLKYQILMVANALRLVLAAHECVGKSLSGIAVEGDGPERVKTELSRDLAIWNFRP